MPRDFGGIHDIYAVVDGDQVAKGGFLIAPDRRDHARRRARSARRSRSRSPGSARRLYESSATSTTTTSTAACSPANWTRGVSVVHIRASGPVGMHTIDARRRRCSSTTSTTSSRRSPGRTGEDVTFTVTKDAGPPRAAIDWPLTLTPTMTPRTTLASVGLDSPAPPRRKLSPTRRRRALEGRRSRPRASRRTRPSSLQWATVVGNRVNCTGTCWTFRPSRSARRDGRGGRDG